MTLETLCATIERKERDSRVPPFERYSWEVWRDILDRLPGYLPAWYRCITMEFRIGGFYFHRSICERDYIGDFLLPRPSSAMCWTYDVGPLPQLFEHGFSTFAEGADGNAWIMHADSNPSDPVYFLESTAWNGDFPTKENGIIDPQCTFLELLKAGIEWKPKEEK